MKALWLIILNLFMTTFVAAFVGAIMCGVASFVSWSVNWPLAYATVRLFAAIGFGVCICYLFSEDFRKELSDSKVREGE